MPNVSIVIPTYNRRDFLRVTIRSALAQTYREYEVIVVDDGSTDGTRELLALYADAIRPVYQSNRGTSGACNAGYRTARGEYLVFLDHDDLIRPDFLELLVGVLAARPAACIAYCAWEYIDVAAALLPGTTRPRREGRLLPELLQGGFNLVSPGAALIRRTCFEQVGPFDESISQCVDWDLWLRFALAGHSFAYVDQPLLRYRIHPHNRSADAAAMARDTRATLEKFFGRPDLPDEIKALRADAFATHHFAVAADYLIFGPPEPARHHLRHGLAASGALLADRDRLLNWLAAVALHPRVANPDRLIDRFIGLLDHERPAGPPFRRRGRGRYHVAAAFSAHASGDPRGVLRHLLPALLLEPMSLRNRGFLSINLRAVLRLARGMLSPGRAVASHP